MGIKNFFMLRKKRCDAAEALKRQPNIVDSEGNSIVNVGVDEDDDFLSPYRDRENVVISEEMAGYLKNATNAIPVKNNLHLKIKCADINETNKENFRQSIKNYYANQFFEVERKLKQNMFAVIITFVLALAFLGLWWLVETLNIPAVLILIIEIVAWVFMWEAVDLLFFERTHLRFEKNKILQLLNAKVSFDIQK